MLHSAMSGPLHHTNSDGEKEEDEGEGDDELDDSDPEVRCLPYDHSLKVVMDGLLG